MMSAIFPLVGYLLLTLALAVWAQQVLWPDVIMEAIITNIYNRYSLFMQVQS